MGLPFPSNCFAGARDSHKARLAVPWWLGNRNLDREMGAPINWCGDFSAVIFCADAATA
jgi:hypothetical protein